MTKRFILLAVPFLVLISGCCGGSSDSASGSGASSATASAAPVAVAPTGDKCKGTENCKKYGDCTTKGTQCSPVTDADCKDSEVCKKEKRCKALNGMCVTP